MLISYITLLSIDNPHAVVVDIAIAIKLIPVRLKVIELDVVAIITNASNDFNNVVFVLYLICFFLDVLLLSLKYVIFFLIMLI